MSRAGIADGKPVCGRPVYCSAGAGAAADVVILGAESSCIVAGLAIDVEVAGILIGIFICLKLKVGIGNGSTLRDIEVVEPQAYRTARFPAIIHQFQVAAGQANATVGILLGIIATRIDPFTNEGRANRKFHTRRLNRITVIIRSDGQGAISPVIGNGVIDCIGSLRVDANRNAVDQKVYLSDGAVAV